MIFHRQILKTVILVSAFVIISSCSNNTETEPSCNSVSLITPEATTETRALFKNLDQIRHEYTLFGHQDALAYGVYWRDEPGRSDVKETTGSYPAVYGWELGDLELGAEKNLDGVHFEKMKGWILEAYKRGGVNTISWHINNPVTGGNAWDTAEGTVEQLLPNGSHHSEFNTMLDFFAGFINDLETSDGTKVPILFRPFHEMNGSWFWWGADYTSADAYKELWRYTVRYLRDEKELNNLIYVYSPDAISRHEQKSEFFNWYPGDAYADVIGLDDYHTVVGRFGFGGDDPVGTLSQHLAWLVRESEERGKIPVFSETGNEALETTGWYTENLLPALLKESDARRIAYVLVWRNANREYDREDHYYVPYPNHPEAESFRQFRNHPVIIFEDDLPDLYTLPECSE